MAIFTDRHPQLGMQNIVADITAHVASGQTLEMPVPCDTLAIWATETDARGAIKKMTLAHFAVMISAY